MKLVFLLAGALIALVAHHGSKMGNLLWKPRRIFVHYKNWTPAPKMTWTERCPRAPPAHTRTGTESRMTRNWIKKLEETRDTLRVHS